MRSTAHLGLMAICCLGFTLPAAAQLDSSALRAKLGAPLNRETFHLPAGFDLIVDYAAGQQVCRLTVPALMPTDENEKVSNSTVMNQKMHDFLADLVPLAARGKEVGRHLMMMGTISVSAIEYEHVGIHETQHADQPFSSDNTITVTFKDNPCQ